MTTCTTTRFRFSFSLFVGFVLIPFVSSFSLASDLEDSITTIRLQSTVRIAADDTELTISDFARVQGPQASDIEALAFDPQKDIQQGIWINIDAKMIRERLTASPHIRVGSVIVKGAKTIAATRLSDPNTTINHSPTTNYPNSPTDGPLLRSYLEQWVYSQPWLKSTKDSTRIRFDDTERVQGILNTPMNNRTVVFNENGRSKKVSCEILILENEQIILETTVRFYVEVLRDVRITSEQIRRGEVIDESRTVVETRWLSPMSAIADATGSLGLSCKKTIDPGSMLTSAMLEEPIIIRRGQFITARSFHGSASVTMSVRAMDDGRLGELIQLESRDRKQHFTAKVAAPGQVIILPNHLKTE
ncbi:MAG: flagellar basal body P-ring formation chaperone FlgA [Phycisphaerales bacterium]|nr:flagellar basal body P-ring formation chaperone FlgA [Phycisphaerales bacterium]